MKSTRQKIRKGIIFTVFLAFPVIFFYFSPALIIAAASEGVVNGSMIMFGVLFVVGLVFGRGFCGWFCGAGGAQEACFMVQPKPAKIGKACLIKYFIWLSWLALIATVAIMHGGYARVDFFWKTEHGISAATPEAYIVLYFVYALLIIPVLIFGKRAFCHYLCWMAPFMILARKIRNSVRWPALRLESDRAKCTQCRLCSKNCPMSLDVAGMVENSRMENSECILCGGCADSCPQKAIILTFK